MIYESLQTWLGEIQKQLAAGHTLIPSDDPSFEGPWYNPTRGALLGFTVLDDETEHNIELNKVKAGMAELEPEVIKTFSDLLKTPDGRRRMLQPAGWLEEWLTDPSWEEDPEALEWLKSRPECLHALMVQFPPSCVVEGTRSLLVPSPGTCGIVSSWTEPDEGHPKGMVSVRAYPDAGLRAQCDPDDLQVFGYWKGWTPEKMRELLGE